MALEMRWKKKRKPAQEQVHKGVYGSPMRDITLIHEVLEFRERLSEFCYTDWQEVPHVGLDV